MSVTLGIGSRVAHPLRWASGLLLLSFAASFVTTLSRAKLWLGPQTAVLGAVGLGMGLLVLGGGWQWARGSGAVRLDRIALARRQVAAVLLVCAVASATILRLAFHAFPNSADEYGFLFAARTFLHHRLWNAPPPDPELFRQTYVIAKDGKWVSQYLPGWPAVLAAFAAVRLPTWLAAPASGAGLLAMLWWALRMECASRALAAAVFLTYATTGFFLLNAATYYSHCVSAMMVIGTIACMLRAERSPDEGWRGGAWPAAAGAFVGGALLCRIDSAVLAGAAAVLAWAQQGQRLRTLALGLAGGFAPIAAFGLYNLAITGTAWLPPTAWAGNVGISLHGLSGVEAETTHHRMLVQTAWRTAELADTASLLVPGFYFAALARRARTRRLRFYDVVPLLNVVVFLIFADLGGYQMGPRYWFDGFAAMQITIASTFAAQAPPWRRLVTACCLLLVPVSLGRLPNQVAFFSRWTRERETVQRLGDQVARALPAGQRAVILVRRWPSAWNDRADRTSPNLAIDFTRNGIALDRPVLYARDDVPDALSRACRLFPLARMLVFYLDAEHPRGELTQQHCS